MADVIAAVDSTTGAFGTLVQNRLLADMQSAIQAGVTTAIQNSGNTATAVANAVTAMTTPTILKNANVLPSASRNAITGWFHADGFGAVGDNSTINTTALQAALNAAYTAYQGNGAAQTVYLPAGVYLVDAVAYYDGAGQQQGIVSLVLRSGVTLLGEGTIKVKQGAYGAGAFYAVIRSDSSGISNAGVKGITIDGNRANNTASTQSSNIQIEALTNIDVMDTTMRNANGNGIMVRGFVGGAAASAIRISGNRVYGCNGIGIQSSQFDGLEIDNNLVVDCTDNCIDIYGEDGTTGAHGGNFKITNNRVTQGLVGIFLETVETGIVAGNWVHFCRSDGIHVNRINGQPTRITITANGIDACPRGVWVTGPTGGVTIRGNTITRFTDCGVALGGGGGSVSRVFIVDNTMDPYAANVALVLVKTQTPTFSFCIHQGTITQSTNRAYDTVNYATSSTSNTIVAALSPGS